MIKETLNLASKENIQVKKAHAAKIDGCLLIFFCRVEQLLRDTCSDKASIFNVVCIQVQPCDQFSPKKCERN